MGKSKSFFSMKIVSRNKARSRELRLTSDWLRKAAPKLAAISVCTWFIIACDSADHEKRVIAARLETMETEKRVLIEQLARLEANAERLRIEAGQAEQEERIVQREQEALLTANPLIAASLGGAGSALEEYESSEAQQREMDGGTALMGILSGAYLLMNPQDTATVLAESQLLEQQAKDLALRRAGIARELEETETRARAKREQLGALEETIKTERDRL